MVIGSQNYKMFILNTFFEHKTEKNIFLSKQEICLREQFFLTRAPGSVVSK